MQQQELIPHLFRTEYRKLIAVLGKFFGIEQIAIVEDIVGGTFLLASETWGLKGLPENPTALLYRVAKHKALDSIRRDILYTQKIAPEIKRLESGVTELEIDLSPQNIKDNQLQMMFAICNSYISTEAQIGLSPNILCGFGIDEIAEALLANKEATYKSLSRAKEKLKLKKVKIELPSPSEISSRLETVLTTLYLLFSEGYYSISKNTTLRKDLCLEAIRLNLMLTEMS